MLYISQSESAVRRSVALRRARRHRAVALLVVAVLVVAGVLLVGSGGSHPSSRSATGAPRTGGVSAGAGGVSRAGPRASSPHLPPIAAAKPGVARVTLAGPRRREIALTFDDGFCVACVARIVRTLAATGAHATIFPNGTYGRSWVPQAGAIRRLVARGQLQVGNHTFLHHDARLESPAAFQLDLSRDELWIERTFGVTARPFFRPPYGAYDRSTLSIAGKSGYTKVIIWSGTVADSAPRSIAYILGAIRHWAKPGAIILMHGNYPATSFALPKILQILRELRLEPVTLQQLLG